MSGKQHDSDYKERVQQKLDELSDIFARAEVGDFSKNVPAISEDDEFKQLYKGLQTVIEAAREKMGEAEEARKSLEDEARRQTKELQRSQQRLKSIVESVPNYIHIADPEEFVITYINRIPDSMEMTDVVGKKIGDFMPPQDAARVRRRLRQVVKNRELRNYEFKAQGEDGELAWYRQTASPIVEDDVVKGVLLITHDISEEKQRTEALKEGKRQAEAARAYDRALLNSIGEGLIVIDDEGRVANINPQGATTLGYTPRELLGEWFPKAVPAVDALGNKVNPLERPAMQALSTGQVISETVNYRRKDGTIFPAAVTISPVVLKGRPVGAIEVFRDLTKEKQLERAKEEFVSLASHQLRTPATGVKAYISMLLDGYAGDLSESQEAFLKKVYESNERQLQIVNDMLNVARVDAGKIVPEMVTTNLKTLLQDIVDEQRPTLKDRGQDMVVTLPAVDVEGHMDPKLVRMALENIVSNASKYTHEGGEVAVRLKIEDSLASITVTDNGVGIAEADLPKLFKRFSRIDNVLSAQRGGSGLGLYLTQTIILLHQGRVRVQSKPGKGTEFRIELPLVGAPNRIKETAK